MSVELVVVAPGLILLLLLVGAGGRVVEAQGHLDGAARDAARAASLAQSPPQASQPALQAAQADLGATSWCAAGSVQAQVAGFPGRRPAGRSGRRRDRDRPCDVNMSPFTLLGFPGHGLHRPGGRPAGRLRGAERMQALGQLRPGPAAERERGSVAVFTVVFAVAVVFLTALIVDGGIAMNARERAADIAEQAARAAAGTSTSPRCAARRGRRDRPRCLRPRGQPGQRYASRTAAGWTGSPAPP